MTSKFLQVYYSDGLNRKLKLLDSGVQFIDHDLNIGPSEYHTERAVIWIPDRSGIVILYVVYTWMYHKSLLTFFFAWIFVSIDHTMSWSECNLRAFPLSAESSRFKNQCQKILTEFSGALLRIKCKHLLTEWN